MEYGLGHLGLSPAEFWGMTLTEWGAAWAGYREKLTGKRGGEALSGADVRSLRAMLGPRDAG